MLSIHEENISTSQDGFAMFKTTNYLDGNRSTRLEIRVVYVPPKKVDSESRNIRTTDQASTTAQLKHEGSVGAGDRSPRYSWVTRRGRDLEDMIEIGHSAHNSRAAHRVSLVRPSSCVFVALLPARPSVIFTTIFIKIKTGLK